MKVVFNDLGEENESLILEVRVGDISGGLGERVEKN